MVLGKVEKGISKSTSVQGSDSESAWLGRWTKLGNEVKYNGESNHSKDNVKERKFGDEGVKVLPFPMFKVSQKRDSTSKLQAFPVSETKPCFHENASSSSKGMANRMPWMYAQGDSLDFPIQEKTTKNLLELIRPVRNYSTFDSVQRVSGHQINLPEEDGHKLLKGSKTNSMKLKGKIFSGYLDLFPNLDQGHKGGVRLQSIESSKETDGPRKNQSSAETHTLEMDRLQTMHFSGSISSSSAKGKGRKGDSDIPRTEPPLVPDRGNSANGHQGETSNSATQCMNVDNFLFRECKRVRLETELESSSRWVKHLKTNASGSSEHDETKSLLKIDASLSQKVNNSLFEIRKSGINNLKPRNQEHATSQIKYLNKGGGEDITLLHPWIQRWCKKNTKSMDQPRGQEVSFESENQKEFEKKQYPSIAAMAMMGKALTGLTPYGLRKTDSLIVWNTRDLR